jgi:hypothetical protein
MIWQQWRFCRPDYNYEAAFVIIERRFVAVRRAGKALCCVSLVIFYAQLLSRIAAVYQKQMTRYKAGFIRSQK